MTQALHFGLGEAETVARVELFWPSGASQVLENLDAGFHYIVSEHGETGNRPTPAPKEDGRVGGRARGVGLRGCSHTTPQECFATVALESNWLLKSSPPPPCFPWRLGLIRKLTRPPHMAPWAPI